MKRIIMFILAAIMLCSCGSADDYETSQYDIYKNGMFHTSDGMLMFLDFDSMVSVPICPKPNCPHTDPNTCSALGISNSRFIYNDKLWWFDSEYIYDENGEISARSTLYSADTDGTNRMKAAVLDGLSVLSSYIYVKNGKAYFEAKDFGNENGMSTGYDKVYLYSYDIESKDFSEIYAVKEGYHAEIYIIGGYENLLALRLTNGIEDKSNLDAPRQYMFYNFDSGEFEECENVIRRAQNDWLITIEDDGTIVVNHAYSDDEFRITDGRFIQAFWGDYRVFDEMLMCTGDGLAYELKTGKVHTTQVCNIIAYYKGKYIVRLIDSPDYVVFTKKELFLD